jgi:ABC-type Zn2+ transport system substrate-binding protein/surface adhesin
MSQPRGGSVLSNLGHALTADLDEAKFRFLHPRRIPLIRSPLEETTQLKEVEQSPEYEEAQAAVKSTDGNHDNKHNHNHHHHHNNHLHQPSPFEYDPDEPPLRYETESSTIQLFYDLFFVANLTTFTAKHEVSDGPSRFPMIPAISG